jgi:hypothetical protein
MGDDDRYKAARRPQRSLARAIKYLAERLTPANPEREYALAFDIIKGWGMDGVLNLEGTKASGKVAKKSAKISPAELEHLDPGFQISTSPDEIFTITNNLWKGPTLAYRYAGVDWFQFERLVQEIAPVRVPAGEPVPVENAPPVDASAQATPEPVASVESPESGRAGAAEQLTYAQIADRLGRSAEAARALVKRRRLPRTRGSDGKTLVAIDLREVTSARSPPRDRPVAVPVPSEAPLPATQPADPARGTSEPIAADEPAPVARSISAAADKMAPAPSAPEVESEALPPDKPAVADSAPSTSKRRGPKPRTIDRFGEDDRALFSDITNLKETKNLTAQEAARELGNLGKVKKRGGLDSAVLRLARRYREEVERKEAPQTNFLALPRASTNFLANFPKTCSFISAAPRRPPWFNWRSRGRRRPRSPHRSSRRYKPCPKSNPKLLNSASG